MKKIVQLLLSAILLIFCGCTAEVVKRSAYETLQNKADMDCRSNPGAKCPEKQSYDEYQRDLNKK